MKKVYLILGASSDLGRALLKSLILENVAEDVYITHYFSDKSSIDALQTEFPNAHIVCYQADLSDLKQTGMLIEEIKSSGYSPNHIISFSASAYKFNRLSELDPYRLDKDMTIQVYSFALTCKAFIPEMVENHYGKIVAMISSATIGTPPKNTTEYTTVKYALLGMLRGLAADYCSEGLNINGVSPGMIETKFIKGIGRKIREFTGESNPRHRNLTVDDVIPSIKLLLSDDSQFMNGVNINLSGILG